jgi:hypothetical protein
MLGAQAPTSILGIDPLSFASLFPSSQPSYIHVSPTNPTNTDISTRDTIQLMNQHALADSDHILIREAAQEILDAAGDSSDEGELIQGTFDYLKEHVSFVEDEDILRQAFGIDSGVELLITPARLLSMNKPMGDCDDFSMLVKAILLNLGIDNDFVTVAADKDNPTKWSHVYNMAILKDGSSKFIDTSHGKYLGWEAPNTERKVVWKLKGQAQRAERGIGMYVDKFDAADGLCGAGGLGDYYDPETGLMITSPFDSAAGGGGGAPPSAPIGILTSPSGNSSNWFASILSPFTRAASQIAVAQFGQPQLAPGTFIRGADGSILTNQPITGGGLTSLTSGLTSLTSSGVMLPLLLVGGALLLFSKK